MPGTDRTSDLEGGVGRRSTLLLLAGVAAPGLARAQLAPPPAPELAPPPTPPSFTPPVPQPAPIPTPAAPARPPPVASGAVDRTKAYYLFFDQMIDVASGRRLREQLAILVEGGVSNITIVMDSPGGQLDATILTYSFIRALPAQIDTHASGFVMSAATLLFLAGQERSADRNAHFLFHPAQSLSTAIGAVGEPQLRERLLSFETIKEVTAQIYHDRTHLADADIERFTRETVIYTADQALASGLVQTVTDLRIPGDGKTKILFLG